ncbi:MAG: DUF3667 domain-containing protein [Arenicella sp.]|nr:DUF3667 domain-containing protein [Arenicella sp.]
MNTKDNCPNCGAILHGAFCSNCGQSQKRTDRFLLSLINEAFEDIFRIDSRAWRTTYGLLFKPGFLSTEYFAGRRARYIPPLRLYVITSLAFFISLSIFNFFSDPDTLQVNGEDTVAVEAVSSAGSDGSEGQPSEVTEAATDQPDKEVQVDDEIEFETLTLPFLSDEKTEQLRTILKRQSIKLREMLEEDPAEFGAILIDLAPPIIFLLLPVFALLLKIAYVFKGMFYTEHLVAAVHNQCFLYLVLLIFSFIPLLVPATWSGWIQFVTGAWIPVYMLLSLKNVYRQSWPLTILKYVVLTVSYLILLFCGMAAAVLVGLLTL